MKIGPLEAKSAAAAPAAPAAAERKPGVANSAPAPAAEASAQVALSPAAAQASGLSTDASFDAAKVDRIAQAIRDGDFKVNAEAIADKLILNAQELLARKPS